MIDIQVGRFDQHAFGLNVLLHHLVDHYRRPGLNENFLHFPPQLVHTGLFSEVQLRLGMIEDSPVRTPFGRESLFLRKIVLGIQAQAIGKNLTRLIIAFGAPAVLLHSLHTQQGVCNIVYAMTRRDVVKPAFSLRKQRFVKTHALSLLGTKNLRFVLFRC